MDEKIPCFCFGSNGLKQLKERVESNNLTASPAVVPGYVRVYSGLSARWDNGAVASIVPCEGGYCLGSVVDLTPTQMAALDRFEGIAEGEDPFGTDGWYRRQWITHHTTLEEAKTKQNEKKSIAYVMNGRKWTCGPSDKYLNACHRNMSQFWACHNVCDTLGKEGEGGKGVFRLPVLNLEATLYRIWSPVDQIDHMFVYGKQSPPCTVTTTTGKTTEIHRFDDCACFLIDERKEKEEGGEVEGTVYPIPQGKQAYLKKMDQKMGGRFVRSVVWVKREGEEGVYAWCYHGKSC